MRSSWPLDVAGARLVGTRLRSSRSTDKGAAAADPDRELAQQLARFLPPAPPAEERLAVRAAQHQRAAVVELDHGVAVRERVHARHAAQVDDVAAVHAHEAGGI